MTKQDEANKFIAHIRKADGVKQTVATHLLQTGEVAKKNAQKVGLPLMGELCGLLHDLGKYSAEFQQYIKSAYGQIDPDAEEFVDVKGKKGKIDHSTAGAQLLWKNCKQEDNLDMLFRQMLALCIASHHSGLSDCIEPDGNDRFSARMNKADEKTHFTEVQKKFDSDASIRQRFAILLNSPELRAELQAQVKKILMIDHKSLYIRDFHYGLLTRFLFSCLIDADRMDTADFASPETAAKRLRGQYVDWNMLIKALESRLSEFKIQTEVDPLRAEISNHCRDFAERDKGLYLLTVPTGGGKTLASLRFALYHAKKHAMTRIIYVVPYISIIDQNADEVRRIFHAISQQEQQEIVLEHHSNLAPEKETLQGKIIAENWDAQIIYTTAVQFLETVFGSGSRGVRRMHQLANTVIIFDEVQTLPVRVVHLFNNAINFLLDLCGSTVVFCTATQPCLDKVEPTLGAVPLSEQQEMMPNVKEFFRKLQRVEVCDERKPGGWSEQEIAELVQKCVQATKSVLIIVNTKKAAKQLYQLCKKQSFDKDEPIAVYHLSTNMCPAHRLDVLANVKTCLDPNHPHPVICISTQLIEAGVDVDFGSVIRYLAGLDSIAQAAGRCNRNGRRERGYVYVVNPAHENLDRLGEIRIAQDKAQRILDEYQRDPHTFDHDIIGIEAMQRYYKYYFFDRASQMAYPVTSFDHKDDLLTLLSTNQESVKIYKRNTQQAPPLFLRQAFQSAARAFKAIDTSTQGIIVPYNEEGTRIINELCAAFDPGKQFRLIKAAQRYSVNLFPRAIKTLCDKRAIFEVQAGSGILYLQPQFYSPDFGVAAEVVNEMEFLNI